MENAKIVVPDSVDNYVWLVNEHDYVEVWYRIGNAWTNQNFNSLINGADARTLAHRFCNNFDNQHVYNHEKNR